MDNVRGIVELKDYGKINIKLSSIMEKRKISVYQLSKLTNLKHSTIKSYYINAPLTRVDLDVLAKICYVLNCRIEDILEYNSSIIN